MQTKSRESEVYTTEGMISLAAIGRASVTAALGGKMMRKELD
jgi:hypothetical protein